MSTQYGSITTASNLSYDPTDPTSMPWVDVPADKPKPMSTLLSSAKRLTTSKLKGSRFRQPGAEWQEDAWELFDLVGEQRFLATTLAGRMGQARFYVGRMNGDNADQPEEIEDETAQQVLNAIGGGAVGMAQLVTRLAVNLFVAGDGWLAGIPSYLMPDSDDDRPLKDQPRLADGNLTLDELEWRMLSVSEVSFTSDGSVRISLGSTAVEEVVADADDLYLIRVWKPHPRRGWEADSPTRASLPVLRELTGLTMHISAQVDSRLAGAGLLLVPQSAQRALKAALGGSEDDDEDVFTEALMEAMMTPISDRSAASAVVPLVVTVPDESAQYFQHITFDNPLDSEARNLRDEAIRRLALGQDAPPELLLGVSGMNHWGAWLVREDVVTTHLEPTLALIADALTTQYLRPVLEEQGYSPEDVENLAIWYDVSHMTSRPNRSNEAQTLHDKGVLSDDALREASGFDDGDAPERSKMDLATSMALDMVRSNSGLLTEPGLETLIDSLRNVLPGGGRNRPHAEEDSEGSDGERVEPSDASPTSKSSAPSAGSPSSSPDSTANSTNSMPFSPASHVIEGQTVVPQDRQERPTGALSRAVQEEVPFRDAVRR